MACPSAIVASGVKQLSCAAAEPVAASPPGQADVERLAPVLQGEGLRDRGLKSGIPRCAELLSRALISHYRWVVSPITSLITLVGPGGLEPPTKRL
jgi:hypothetical protein